MRTRILIYSAVLVAALAARSSAQPAPAAPAQPVAVPANPAVTIDAGPSAGVSTRMGDTLTVSFPDEEIRTILNNVADLFDLNIIIPETLQGKTSIKLRNVTWMQIFQNVLAPVGYTYVQDGTIIKIVSNDSLQQEPTDTKVFLLNYAKASEIVPVISGMIDSTAGGKIMVDARTNALVITERPSRMTRVQPLIDALDRPTDQVMIETKFVEVTDGDIRNIGVNWSTLKNYKLGGKPAASATRVRGQTLNDGIDASNNTSGGSTSTTTTNNTNTTNGSTTVVTGTTPSNSTTTGTGSNTSIAIQGAVTAASDSAFNLLQSIANSGSTTRSLTAEFTADQFGIVISALNELSTTKVVSNPRVVTLNNVLAKINVGEEDPIPRYSYNEQRGSFEVSGFEYKSIGINLEVTPQVNARGFIKLAVKPEVSQKNGSVNFGGAGGAEIPIIATRKADLQVSIADGNTMGIGGLLTSSATNGSTKVPFFGDIPLLGNLFKSKSKNNTQTNLLIFITAKTINVEGAPIEQIFDPRQIRSMGLKQDELPGYRDGSPAFEPAPVK